MTRPGTVFPNVTTTKTVKQTAHKLNIPSRKIQHTVFININIQNCSIRCQIQLVQENTTNHKLIRLVLDILRKLFSKRNQLYQVYTPGDKPRRRADPISLQHRPSRQLTKKLYHLIPVH